MKALFGKIRFKVVVDLRFGDFINPNECVLPLKFNEKDLFELQNCWKRHLKGLKNNHTFPREIKDVIFEISMVRKSSHFIEVICINFSKGFFQSVGSPLRL